MVNEKQVKIPRQLLDLLYERYIFDDGKIEEYTKQLDENIRFLVKEKLERHTLRQNYAKRYFETE